MHNVIHDTTSLAHFGLFKPKNTLMIIGRIGLTLNTEAIRSIAQRIPTNK